MMKRVLCALLALVLWAGGAWAERGVVLVLSGGGVKGYAHIGVLQELEKAGIRPIAIVGTSIGSLVGGLYAVGYTPADLEDMALHSDIQSLMSDEGNRVLTRPSAGQTTPAGGARPEVFLDKRLRVVGPLGVFSGNRLLQFLNEKITEKGTSGDFLRLPTPFAAVATDLITGEKVQLTSGSLAGAMRASMSIPGVFDPWEIGGHLLVDGGLVSNLPVRTAKDLFPGYPVLAVDLSSDLFPREKIGALPDVFNQTLTIMTSRNVAEESPLADYVLQLHVPEYSLLTPAPVESIIELGREKTRQALEDIRAIAVPYNFKGKNSSFSPLPVGSVTVKGLSQKADGRNSKALTRKWQGKTYDPLQVSAVVKRLSGRDDVRFVNTSIEEKKGAVDLLFDVTRYPKHRIGLTAYGSTMAGRGWGVLTDTTSDIFQDGDVLRTRLFFADDFAAEGVYQGADLQENPWVLTLAGSRFSLHAQKTPDWPDGRTRWTRYGVKFEKSLHFGPHHTLWAGLRYDWLAFRGAAWGGEVPRRQTETFFAPYLTYEVAWQNHDRFPTIGAGLSLTLLYPFDVDRFVGQAVLHGGAKLSNNSLIELTAGYTQGSTEHPFWTAYLGVKGELYSRMGRPIASDHFFWARAAWGLPLKETILGDSDVQLFAGWARAWGPDGRKIAEPWEAGLLFSAPKKLLNAQAFAVYTHEREWRFGITIGQSDLSPYLPF